jgi:radical SAM protein with 4Fe4S-binding SPASM domain
MSSQTPLRTRLRNYLLWQKHKLRMAELYRTHPLRYLFLEVTRQCNLACLYCGSSCTGKPPASELSIAQWKELVDLVAKDFDPRTIMVAVTGGEPLIKEGIFDLFEALRNRGFRYGMVSNAKVLDRRSAEALVKAGIGSISLSMDALPEVNDRLRGRGISAKVAEAVGHLREAGYKGKLEIISTITKPAMASLDEMRRHVASLQVPLWRVAPVMPIGRAAEHPELIPDAGDIRYMLEWIRQARKDTFIPSPEFSEEGFVGYRYEGNVRPYLCQCRAGITVGGIRYDGRIGACPELADTFDQGNIHDDDFKTVWDTRYQVFRDRRWARKGPCRDCRFWSVCRGGALHLYEDTEKPFLRCLYLMCKETDGRPLFPPQVQEIPCEAIDPEEL